MFYHFSRSASHKKNYILSFHAKRPFEARPFSQSNTFPESTTSLLTAATLEYTRGAGITAAAGT